MAWWYWPAVVIVVVAVLDTFAGVLRRLAGAKRCTCCGRYDRYNVAVCFVDTLTSDDGETTAVTSVDWVVCRRCMPSLGDQFRQFYRFAAEFKATTAGEGA